MRYCCGYSWKYLPYIGLNFVEYKLMSRKFPKERNFPFSRGFREKKNAFLLGLLN